MAAAVLFISNLSTSFIIYSLFPLPLLHPLFCIKEKYSCRVIYQQWWYSEIFWLFAIRTLFTTKTLGKSHPITAFPGSYIQLKLGGFFSMVQSELMGFSSSPNSTLFVPHWCDNKSLVREHDLFSLQKEFPLTLIKWRAKLVLHYFYARSIKLNFLLQKLIKFLFARGRYSVRIKQQIFILIKL